MRWARSCFSLSLTWKNKTEFMTIYANTLRPLVTYWAACWSKQPSLRQPNLNAGVNFGKKKTYPPSFNSSSGAKLMHVVWQSGLQLRPFKHPNKSHLLPCTAVNVASQSGPMMWVLLCAVLRNNVKVFLMLFWTPARHCQVRDHRLRQRFNSCKLEHTGYF